MQVNINISEEQEKALLTKFISIEVYLQQMIDTRAWKIMGDIVREYAKGNCEIIGITTDEQAIIDEKLKDKIIVNADNIPNDVKEIIVRRADLKSAVDKIKEEKEKIKK